MTGYLSTAFISIITISTLFMLILGCVATYLAFRDIGRAKKLSVR
jgi:hypothetical protein